jgi:predicted DCC family thiol-disulfide oxidoreductase YuxK
MGNITETASVLLYDGVCGFCNRYVQMILKHDRRGTMRFAALQSEFAKAVMERHPALNGFDTVVLLETVPDTGEERVSIRSTAALRVAAYLGGWWRLLLVTYAIPTPIRDCFYALFARYRYKIFGQYDRCILPPANVRSRFLDLP